jgi:hypothetical protein
MRDNSDDGKTLLRIFSLNTKKNLTTEKILKMLRSVLKNKD